MSKAPKYNKRAEVLDEEVAKRLPYWVRELLKMLEEAKKSRAPSASSSEAP